MKRAESTARSIAIDIAALILLRVALSVGAIRHGFSSVSDDDFARTVIAEWFAYAPKIDPSGTSWLPFPFWITGAAMMLLGRTIAVAKMVAWGLGSVGVGALYLSLRQTGAARLFSFLAVFVGLLAPWNVWLGVASVPEVFTAYFAATALVSAGDRENVARPYALVLLFCASLSRYEAWPICGVVACAEIAKAVRIREVRRVAIASSLFALSGPAVWMVWNRVSHGGFLHFLFRVSRFRKAVGEAEGSLVSKLISFPTLLLRVDGVLVALAVFVLILLLIKKGRFDARLVARAHTVFRGALAVLLFLAIGSANDGAPTHHAERALLPVILLLCVFCVDAGGAWVRTLTRSRSAREAWAFAFTFFGAIMLLGSTWHALATPPGSGPGEERIAQVARGQMLKSEGVSHVTVEPCAYEHFALIAAFGAPEKVEILEATHQPVTRDCPRVAAR